jgi:hypothetical protein
VVRFGWVRPAGADQAQHLPLPPGEPGQLRVQRHRRIAAEGVQHKPGKAGREVGVAGADPRDGLAQLRARDRLDGHGWRIGSSVPVALPGTTKTHTFTVTAIYDTGSSLIALLAPAGYQRLGRDQSSGTVLARTAAGVTPAAARAAIDRALPNSPSRCLPFEGN